jgi:hypothetical protein
METSLLKTFAAKHHSMVSTMAEKHKGKMETPLGSRTCFEAIVERGDGRKPLVARFGGIPLKRQKKAVLRDRVPGQWEVPRPKELVLRLVAGRCEICGQSESIRVHHIRKTPTS